MILRRPLLTSLGSCALLLAGASAGRANPETSSVVATDHRSPPAGVAELSVPNLSPGDGEHEPVPNAHQSAATNASRESDHSEVNDHSTTTNKLEKSTESEKVTSAEAAPATDEAHREIAGLQKLGLALTERSDWDAAEIAFRQILTAPRANGNDLASALLGLARVYRREGSLTKAAAIYERYLKDYPAAVYVPDALLELGRTHRALGAHQLAIAAFYSVINSTLKLTSENSEHYQVLAKTAQFEIAETHFQDGEYAEANKFFSRLRLLDLAPADRARAHFKSADALYLDNNFEGAVKTLNSYLEQWPQDENVPEARYLLSLSLRSLGRKQEALDATLALLRTEKTTADPKRWSYWQRRTGNQLANDFFQNGDTLNALMIYQGLADLSTEPEWRLPVAYQIGLCYERMRLYDRAITAYQSIVDNASPSAAATNIKNPETSKITNAELSELARMAAWRIGQLNWNEQTERQMSAIFTPGAAPTPQASSASHTIEPNIDTNVSSQPTSTPGNEHSGNPSKTSASL
jgi:tetratricopeptide (TPR) repeat protein